MCVCVRVRVGVRACVYVHYSYQVFNVHVNQRDINTDETWPQCQQIGGVSDIPRSGDGDGGEGGGGPTITDGRRCYLR